MPRSGRISKRKMNGDAVYNSLLIHKFINKLMYDGKKSKAEAIVYAAMESASKKLNKEPLEVFQKVIDNLIPLMEVKSRRVGGATYQVPVEVSKDRACAFAIKWLREAARERSGKGMAEKLSAEMLEAYAGSGNAMKKKEDMHKTAEANKAFAHFRW